MTVGPIRDIAAFAGALRGRGLTVTPDQTSDMASALLLVDPAERNQVYAAMRCLTVNDPAEIPAFDAEFTRFFDGLHAPITTEPHSTSAEALATSSPLLQPAAAGQGGEASDTSGASALEKLGARDFSTLDDDDLVIARRLVANMSWQPSDFRTRRWKPGSDGQRPDLRRTFGRAVGPAGDLMQLEMRDRRRKQRPLIVIADVSGSMEKYADLFLVFAHAATRRLHHVETFTFSTHLTRITDDMNRRDTKSALARVTETVPDWSGGTQIGAAFGRWNKDWSRRMARGGPIALILSDGWDCGDPYILSLEMARLSRSVHRVIWLNPLAASAGYRPATRGMQSVLPHIDHLLPAASVNDLKSVVSLLETMEVRGRA